MNHILPVWIIDPYGYIYIRSHHSYDKYDVCKLGKTINIIIFFSLLIFCLLFF